MHYKRMLIKRSGSQHEAEGLIGETKELLERLIEVDPFRRARYEELGVWTGSRLVQRAEGETAQNTRYGFYMAT